MSLIARGRVCKSQHIIHSGPSFALNTSFYLCVAVSSALPSLLAGPHLPAVHLEEVNGLRGVVSGNVVEGRGSDVVRLALAHEAVVLEDVLLFRIVVVSLRF